MNKHAYSLDAFRVIAIFCVFLEHLFYFNEGLAEDEKILPAYHEIITHFGVFAVHFFILLSAFLVGLFYEKSKTHGYAEYVRKRAKRLLPLNMVVLPFYIVMALYLGLHVFSWSLTIPDIFLASLLLQELFRFSSYCFNVPAWTISTLFILYLLTPLLMWPLKKIKHPWMLVVMVIVFTVADLEYRDYLLEIKPHNTWINYASPINRILSYMAGLTLGYTVNSFICMPNIRRYAYWLEVVVFGVLICGCSVIKSNYTACYYTMLYTMPALITVCYMEEGIISRAIAKSFVSKASPYVYAFYMSHFFFILLAYAICERVLGIWGKMSLTQVPFIVIATFICTCTASFLLHHYVEKRMA